MLIDPCERIYILLPAWFCARLILKFDDADDMLRITNDNVRIFDVDFRAAVGAGYSYFHGWLNEDSTRTGRK